MFSVETKITITTILFISSVSGNTVFRGSNTKEPIHPGFCFGLFNFCATGYKCKKVFCVEERHQMIKGKSIAPCLRGLCPTDSICYDGDNRCYLME